VAPIPSPERNPTTPRRAFGVGDIAMSETSTPLPAHGEDDNVGAQSQSSRPRAHPLRRIPARRRSAHPGPCRWDCRIPEMIRRRFYRIDAGETQEEITRDSEDGDRAE